MTRRAFAQESSNLGTNSVPVSRKRQYSDVDLTLAVKPTTGDVYKKLDAAAVKQSIKNLLMTNRLEKPFRPDYGANLRTLLFELLDNTADMFIRSTIMSTIRKHEPRVRVLDVQVYADEYYKNEVQTVVTFRLINTSEVIQISTKLSRLR